MIARQGTKINREQFPFHHLYAVILANCGLVEFCFKNCNPGSFQDDQVKGKIILCESKDDDYSAESKFESLKKQGAIGMLLINDNERAVASSFGSSPVVVVIEEDGAQIFSYINSTR
ncbi:unnamed protein product [Fraxinus pennsylvanica]|uniref:PA domain-containing protein n=1 Tax=Fraxinus pennsylvanica TaxID=56036 RepID=A0AAD2A3I0_9LAMI|nr:unnamed protein product [Fraxinus pennsylvanica]